MFFVVADNYGLRGGFGDSLCDDVDNFINLIDNDLHLDLMLSILCNFYNLR